MKTVSRCALMLGFLGALAAAPVAATDGGPASATLDAGTSVDEPEPEPEPGPEPEPEFEFESEDPPKLAEVKAHPVLHHGEEVPLAFRVSVNGRGPEARAREASKILSATLGQVKDTEAHPSVTVVVDGDMARVKLGTVTIATLTRADASAEGKSLEDYASALEPTLTEFVHDELQQKSLAEFFQAFFFSVFGLLLGFLTLRTLRNLFDRLDQALDERRHKLKPIELFRVPVFSTEAVSGGLAVASSFGRVLSYIVCVVSTFALVFAQWELTRPVVRQVGEWSVGPIARGLEALVTKVPGLLLAALLYLVLRAGLRVLDILLDGVKSKQITWKGLPPERVSPFRLVAQAATVLIFAPLIVAAVFGGFDTPTGVLALTAGVVVMLAAVPVLVSYAIGLGIMWRGMLRPGDWVQVGEVSGEVTEIAYHEVRLVPESGGVVDIPSLYLLWRPIRRLRTPPEISFELTLTRDRPAQEILEAVRRTIQSVDEEAKAEAVDLAAGIIIVRVSAPTTRNRVREQLVLAIADAVDDGSFTFQDEPARD